MFVVLWRAEFYFALTLFEWAWEEILQNFKRPIHFLIASCLLFVLVQGRAPVIWQVDGLPHDSWDLVAVPAPVGGVQVRKGLL